MVKECQSHLIQAPEPVNGWAIDEKGKFRIEYVPTSNPYPIEFIDSMEDDNEDDVVDEDSIVLTTNESEENKLLYVQCTYQSSSEN